jgi:amidase
MEASAASWQTKVAEKRAQRQKAIPTEWLLPESVTNIIPPIPDLSKFKINLIDLDIPRKSGLLTQHELEITEDHDVASLLEHLSTGRLTSAEVTLAFCKRAAVAQQLVSSVPRITVQPWLMLTYS